MRTTTVIATSLAAAGAATALAFCLVGSGTATAHRAADTGQGSQRIAADPTGRPAAEGPRTQHQEGIVLECTSAELPALVSIYENSRHGSHVQVVLGDRESDRIGFGQSKKSFRDGNRLITAVRLEGHSADVTGTVEVSGPAVPVIEEYGAAGEEQPLSGTHRNLDARLTLAWNGQVVALDCDMAFAYDLEVELQH